MVAGTTGAASYGYGVPAGVSPDWSAVAASKEYETEIHFQKCYGVIREVFEAHNNLENVLPARGFKFLDLGCAPGGFSSFLLADPRCGAGFGVTLPSLSGGFPVRVRDHRFFLQQADLFEVGPADLLASDVNVVIADAQYLRNNVAWDDKYRGVRCRSKQHGVWALLTKQLWLGLTKLQQGGILMFRFGWRDPGPHDPATVWYKRQTLRLFTLLHDLFEEVREQKSDYYNALQSSFYVCCSKFDRDKFLSRGVGKLLGHNFNYLVTTDIQDSNDLELFVPVDKLRTQESDDRISGMLDRINKLRLVHEGSRRRHQETESRRDDPRAVLFLARLPDEISEEVLRTALSKFGRVKRIDKDETGGEVSVQFAFVDQAKAAAIALRGGTADLGGSVRVRLREEDATARSTDAWAREWVAPQPSCSTAASNHDVDNSTPNGNAGSQVEEARPSSRPDSINGINGSCSSSTQKVENATRAPPPGFEKGKDCKGKGNGKSGRDNGKSNGSASAMRNQWVPKDSGTNPSDSDRRPQKGHHGQGKGKGPGGYAEGWY